MTTTNNKRVFSIRGKQWHKKYILCEKQRNKWIKKENFFYLSEFVIHYKIFHFPILRWMININFVVGWGWIEGGLALHFTCFWIRKISTLPENRKKLFHFPHYIFQHKKNGTIDSFFYYSFYSLYFNEKWRNFHHYLFPLFTKKKLFHSRKN